MKSTREREKSTFASTHKFMSSSYIFSWRPNFALLLSAAGAFNEQISIHGVNCTQRCARWAISTHSKRVDKVLIKLDSAPRLECLFMAVAQLFKRRCTTQNLWIIIASILQLFCTRGVYISNALASLRLANSAETHQDARRLTARVIYDRCLFTHRPGFCTNASAPLT